eukprot:3244654-Rhodomonas_salina.1
MAQVRCQFCVCMPVDASPSGASCLPVAPDAIGWETVPRPRGRSCSSIGHLQSRRKRGGRKRRRARHEGWQT